ncbi:MAG: GTP 3',8-cyclase MoaA [Candidatus Firestonebacteria bacterium]
MLIDSLGRKIDYLRVSITDRCNLNCIYCMPDKPVIPKSKNEILSFEELEKMIGILVSLGIKKIKITGGEPLVRKGVIEFIKKIYSINGLEDISLTTNGILLKEYARDLKNAGLKRINISLDTLHNDKFIKIARGCSLSQVLAGIDEVQKLNFSPIKINTVVIKNINDDEILDFIRLCIENPYIVRFIEYMPTYNSLGWSNDKFVSIEEIKNICSKYWNLTPMDTISGGGPAKYFQVKGGAVGFIGPISSYFCFSCNRLRLTADGKLKLCLHSPEEVDLKTLLRNKHTDNEIKNTILSAVSLKSTGKFFNSYHNENIMCQVGG